ncbi:MAG: preprotein translocase subunit SecY [Bacilli bacterium]
MLYTLKQLFIPSNKDVLKRVLFTIAILLLFYIGTFISVPGAQSISTDLGYLEFINIMGGGAFKNFSIFALGVSPYITVSIITGLLQMDIVPYFSELKNQGDSGRRKLNQINRYLAILVAFIQGYIFSLAFLGNASVMDIISTSLILTAGTAFLLWIGDRISSNGVGNGISQIIMAGIVFTLPSMFASAYDSLVDSADGFLGYLSFGLFILLYILIIVGVIYVQLAERRIPMQYSNRGAGINNNTFLPFKLNSAGVMPVIFSSMVFTIPTFILAVVKNESVTLFINKYLTSTSIVGTVIFVLLIFLFCYVYTFMNIRPSEVSKNLKSSGAYIPGIRPGKETTEYLTSILTKLTFIGSIFLIIIALLPRIFLAFSSLPTNVQIGGTSILIVVGVAVESYKQIETMIQNREIKYKK